MQAVWGDFYFHIVIGRHYPDGYSHFIMNEKK